LGLPENSPLDSWDYAQHLKVQVVDVKSLGLSPESLHQLTAVDPESWSAMTIQDGESFLIVINSTHARTRQQNDLMHELSHVELEHKPARVDVSKSGVILLSEYSDDQEQEADWHAAALLLPRDGILQMRSQGMSATQIASHYGVSESLCQWRIRMTGVDVQMQRRAR
jgi:Zn-dependent peptidase ImmA (M78 family)